MTRLSYHNIISTPFGAVAVIYRIDPFRLEKVLLPGKDVDALIGTGRMIRETDDVPLPVKAVSDQIKRYFTGMPIHPPWDVMDLSEPTALQITVLKKTAQIPFGRLRSYEDVAVAVNRPRAYRFVGTSLGKNPFPLLIPCHRVIRKDGRPGRFGGGTDLKRKLIDHEATHAIK